MERNGVPSKGSRRAGIEGCKDSLLQQGFLFVYYYFMMQMTKILFFIVYMLQSTDFCAKFRSRDGFSQVSPNPKCISRQKHIPTQEKAKAIPQFLSESNFQSLNKKSDSLTWFNTTPFPSLVLAILNELSTTFPCLSVCR